MRKKAIGKLASRFLKAQREFVELQRETEPMSQLETKFYELKERERAMQRELDTIDREIDSAVFDLYGLNKTEVGAVLSESFDYLPPPQT